MARRKKTSPAEDIIDLIALLPWYVGVILAIAGYLVLHRIAIAPLATAVGAAEIAKILFFIFLALFVISLLVGMFRRSP